MKRTRKLPILALFAAFAVSASPLCRAGMLDDLSSDQQSTLAAGDTVVTSSNVQGSVWPRLQLFRVANAPLKTVVALLNDVESAPSYTPGMLAAKVLSTNPDGTKDVEYTVKVPILQKISYSVQNTYKKTANSYEVSWTLIKSPLAKASDGSIRAEPYGKNQTLVRYTNLTVPITSLVAGLKNQASKEAQTTIAAITAEAEKRASQ